MAGSSGWYAAGQGSKSSQSPRVLKQQLLLGLAILGLLLVIGVSAAFAEDGGPAQQGGPTVTEVEEAIEDPGVQAAEASRADLQAAEELPHQNLSRSQANELLTGVFGPELQGPAGIFDELEVEKFYSDNVALIAAGDQPGIEGEPEGPQPTLLESSLPLRVEDSSGHKEAVDLGLENSEGNLQPVNPMVELEIPSNLEEGISLPESGVEIELAGAPAERAPSTVDQSIATYPNVAEDTMLAVAPTPTGLETLTLLQSADAPTSQTFKLTLPAGASLRQTEDGGAEIIREGEPLIKVRPPSALDANEDPVPVSLKTTGDSIVINAEPTEDSALPILVDPMWETYDWYQHTTTSFAGWDSFSNSSQFTTSHNGWQGEGLWNPGLQIASGNGSITPGAQARWDYHVPRFATDLDSGGQHIRPTSYINRVIFEKLFFDVQASANNPLTNDPFLAIYIWDDEKGFISISHHWGTEGNLSNLNYQYNLYNSPPPNEDTGAKQASLELVSSQTKSQYRQLYVGWAGVELSDKDFPTLGAIGDPIAWVNGSPSAPIQFTSVTDTGLGVREVAVTEPSKNGGSQKVTTAYSPGCTGGTLSPCPRNWKSTEGPPIKYDPSLMPQGENLATVDAVDPIGHWASQKPNASAAEVLIKVDRTPPSLGPLAGTLTEQDKIGTNASQYTLKYSATDGDHEAPTPLSSFGEAGTGEGKLQRPRGIAIDASGNIWVVDRENSRVEKFDGTGKFLMQFGTAGSASGQFKEPCGVAISATGTIWVSDGGNHRVQAFNSKGEFIRAINYASFIEPYGLATGPGEVLWISDPAAHRVFEFSESGTFIRKVYGSASNPSGESDLNAPVGLATDAQGNLWVVDSLANRVQEFDTSGKFMFQFGSAGTGSGQFQAPAGIAIAGSGHLLITDGSNNRVQGFQPSGAYLRQFGSTGAGNGQLSEPRGIAVGAENKAFVVDAGNHRVTRWSHADLSPQSGVTSTEVKVDGQLVEPKYAPGCATRDCTVTREWTLKANDYEPGPHELQVTATDGVGLATSTKALKFTTIKDTTKPKLTALSSFFTMPQGWVEQKTYSYSTTFSDSGGYGVTSLVLKIDGKVVKSTTQSCPNGACSATLSGLIDMAAYQGGAHPAELLATDAAGNTKTYPGTFNVNPDGDVPSWEAIDTIDAADATSKTTTVAPTEEILEPEQIAGGDNPGLKVDGTSIKSTGVPDTTSMTTDISDGFTIQSPEGATTITPNVAADSSPTAIAANVAAVSANTKSGVDSVVRPEYDGAQTFQAIRESTSPESFSWTMHLYTGQHLELINDEQAQVVYEDGRRVFLISSETAHDATGATVPTSLVVDGTTLTLVVHHQEKGFVYPIVAGQGWETAYAYPILVEMPKASPPPGSLPTPPFTIAQIERMARGFGALSHVEAPPYPPNGGANISKIRNFEMHAHVCQIDHCALWDAQLYNTTYIRGPNWVKWEPESQVHCKVDQDFPYNLIIQPKTWNCGKVGPEYVEKGEGKHLTTYAHFTIETYAPDILDGVSVAQENFALQDWVYPNGYQEGHVRPWSGAPSG